MAVPRPVLLAILGLALCVTALVAVRGVGVGEEDPIAPAPIPSAPAEKAQPSNTSGARGRARTRPRVDKTAPAPADAKPAEDAGTKIPEVKPEAAKPSKAQIAELRSQAEVKSVGQALAQNEVVVLFFSRPGAADDTSARGAVQSLRRVDGVQVFSPNFEDLDEYRPILAGVGVAQMPAIVIVAPGRKAQLVEGFVDRKSLRQQVEDAVR